MARVCFVLVAGLDRALLEQTPGLKTLAVGGGGMKHAASYRPAFPAVTCTAQATLTTGATAGEHGIICNGLYTHNRPALWPHLDLANHADTRKQVTFWEQSNSLLERPRFWQGMNKKVAMLFWQNAMCGAADVVVTPKPQHGPDGKPLTACWSSPANLYPQLVEKLGPFPLMNYWSPMAGLPSSQWIVKCAEHVWETQHLDLQLVYIPQLDFNLLRKGPNDPAVVKDLQDIDMLLAALAQRVRLDGGIFVVAGDYGMNAVSRYATPNLTLRQAGLLKTKSDESGKLVVDYDASDAFAMVDHQVSHVYMRQCSEDRAATALQQLPGIEQVLRKQEIAALGLNNQRTGDLVLLAAKDAWLAHDWWESDAEKPRWQFTVDIHSKPGFDTRELFFDPVKKCIAQDAGLVKGSHGLVDDPARWPMLLGDVALPVGGGGGEIKATVIAAWLKELLTN
ncbi:MAG: alkaline phosphatase family protein [Phycisphaerales bacterium]|nr:alkaline phosphatase family protein [Phycisphaerales bacterium]